MSPKAKFLHLRRNTMLMTTAKEINVWNMDSQQSQFTDQPDNEPK